MLVLREDELRRLSDVANAMEQDTSASEVSSVIVGAMNGLISSDSAGLNVIEPAQMTLVGLCEPAAVQTSDLAAVLDRRLPEHPLLAQFLRTGTNAAVRFSDLMSLKQLRRLPIYQEFYRPLGWNRFMACARPIVQAGATKLVVVAFGRDRCDFSDAEQQMLTLAQQYAVAAFKVADQRAWITAALSAIEQGDATRNGILLLGPHETIRTVNATAVTMLASHFQYRGREGATLPEELTTWLRAQQAQAAADGPPRRRPYRTAHRAGTLTITFVPTAPHGALILAERHNTNIRDTPQVAGLTRRETEVLWLAAHGHTSTAIGRGLAISARTVEQHLSNAYRKLGVQNRAQAAVLAFSHSGLASP